MDFASTPTHAKGVALVTGHEEGRTEATAARPSKASSPPTADGVDKMYRQLAEAPDDGGVMPFPREDTVMMIYDRHPSLGVHRVSDLGPGTLARCGWGRRDVGI
jgi:hypothetical protein